MRRRRLGFTLIELLVVLVLIAVAAGVASLALRDGDEVRLAREGARLAALFESARAESRALGLPVTWEPVAEGFRFDGLPQGVLPAQAWLEPQVQARIVAVGAAALGLEAQRRLQLGPEPLLPPQRVELSLGPRRLAVVSDGLGPFAAMPAEAAAAGVAAAEGADAR